eukprot:gene1559-32941_t
MANYYHEARAQVKNLKVATEANKRKAERRAEVADAQAEHPLNLLVVDGRSSKLHKNVEQYKATERQDGLIPWNGDQDNLIDRFDGRALLDFLVDKDQQRPGRPETETEVKLKKVGWEKRGRGKGRRGDGRALLDFLVDKDRQRLGKPETETEVKLKKSFRDLVRLEAMGLNEAKGLAFASSENISIRAAARTAATAAYAVASGRVQQPSSSAAVAAAG